MYLAILAVILWLNVPTSLASKGQTVFDRPGFEELGAAYFDAEAWSEAGSHRSPGGIV